MEERVLVREDLLFSNWIVAWFLLYFFGWVEESPKLLIVIALLVTGITSGFIIMTERIPPYNAIKHGLINVLFKVLPLIYLWKKKITVREVYISVGLIIPYILWTLMNGTNPVEVYVALKKSYMDKNSKERTRISYLYDEMYKQIVKMGHSVSSVRV
jgi:hypothetical protein